MNTSASPHRNGAKAELERTPDVTRVGGDIGELFEDISTLIELQFKLFAIDINTTLRRAIAPLGAAIVGMVLLVSCVPVLLMGLAWLLVEQADWSTGPALLATAGVAAVLGAVAAALGGLLLRKSGAALDRSRVELAENIRWIKAAFNRRRIRERKLTP
jgi:hypothetical protein